MADYDLSLTGAQVDAAINKAHSPDTQPVTNSSNLITSGGVKTAIEGITLPIDTNLSSGSNLDTTVPSSLAVQNYVTNATGTSALTRRTMLTRYGEYSVNTQTTTNQIPSIVASVNNDLSYSNNRFNINPGTYLVFGRVELKGGYRASSGSNLYSDPTIFEIESNDTIDGLNLTLQNSPVGNTSANEQPWQQRSFKATAYFDNASSWIRIYLYNASSPSNAVRTAYSRNLRINFLKLP